jgi:DNA-binding response OmpR family regulator
MNANRSGSRGPIKIVVVEDNEDIQDAAHLIFELHWPEAKLSQAYTGSEGLSLMKSVDPDLVVLDLGLPDIDGMKVLKDIRNSSDVPVIILTVRGEETDKVRGLELGADDFIVKPFSHKELLARIRAVMNRRKATTPDLPAVPVHASDVKIDLEEGTVTKDGKPVKLTGTEFNLLKYLYAQGGTSLADEDILRQIWGEEYTDCSEYLEAYIRRLREKLEDDPFRPRMLLREKNGYRFVLHTNQHI